MNKGLQIAAGLSPDAEMLSELKTLAQHERDYIETILHLCHGNISKAAGILDISASTLYRKRESWRS